MSPGRSRSSSADSSPGALPMWHMTRAPRTPERSQARIARLSGSRPFAPTTSTDSRTLMPSTSSGFSASVFAARSEEHTSELQSRFDLVCRLLLEKKKKYIYHSFEYTKNEQKTTA